MSDHNTANVPIVGIQVDPLPAELQEWHYLPEELFRKPWEHFAPFLASHGYILANTPEYDREPDLTTAPRKPAMDPFHPTDDEDFVHRLFLYEGASLRLKGFFQERSTGYLGLDSHQRNVYLKAVPVSSSEWEIIQHMSTDPLRADPRNHTIPKVEILCAGDWVFIIQAHWSALWQWPPMDTVWVRLEMGRQLVEGLVFMHENGVSHGDIHTDNIVWNHDNRRGAQLNVESGQRPIPFQSTFDFRFAFIDFGCAIRFPPNVVDHVAHREHTPPSYFAAPEQSQFSEPYDVFAADVFNLGRVLQSELDEAIRVQCRLDSDIQAVAPPAYLSLLELMTKKKPSDRPSAQEALRILDAIIEFLNASKVHGEK